MRYVRTILEASLTYLAGLRKAYWMAWLGAATYLVVAPSLVLSETYRCNSSTYTNRPENYSACQIVQSSVICSGDGNKFVSPHRVGLQATQQSCEVTHQHTSPFVDLKAVKNFRAVRRVVPKAAQMMDSGLAQLPSLPMLGKLGPVEAGKIIECASGAIFDGKDPAPCIPEL